MEWLTIILGSFLTIITPAGLIVDRVVADRIRSQVADVETLAVRVDNTPSYQVLQGKIDRVRLASRGLYPISGLRLDVLEVETDPINVNIQRLQKGGKNVIPESLRQPAQLAVRLEVKEDDINKALQSPEIKEKLQKLVNRLLPKEATTAFQIELQDMRVELLENNRLRMQLQVKRVGNEPQAPEAQAVNLVLETGINVIAGKKIELVEPSGTLNGRKLSTRLLKGFAEGLNKRLDLQTLEQQNILARILQFQITDDRMNLVTFARITPGSSLEN